MSHYLSFLGGSAVKNPLAMQKTICSAGDTGLIPGSERASGEGNSNPLQYSRLENPTDRGAWGATVYGVVRVGHDLVTKPPLPPHCLPFTKLIGTTTSCNLRVFCYINILVLVLYLPSLYVRFS